MRGRGPARRATAQPSLLDGGCKDGGGEAHGQARQSGGREPAHHQMSWLILRNDSFRQRKRLGAKAPRDISRSGRFPQGHPEGTEG